MRSEIKKISLFFVVLVFAFVMFYLVNINIQKSSTLKAITSDFKKIETSFEHIGESDIKTLSSALEIIIQDLAIKEIYMERNRERLYNHVKPLFEELKTKYGITHWYFILPDGHTFLRVHNKEFYDDEITRFTFYGARDTKEVSSGIELGKTAYALRVVMPYYDEGELIGYVELGEEIDHFLDILGEETGDEFILAVDKKYLDEEKWASVREKAGLRNNWDDSLNYLVISPLALEGNELILRCFTNENLVEGARGKLIFQILKEGDDFYQCAGVPLIDAGNRQSGTILSLIDINSYKSFTKSSNLTILGFLVLIFILMALMSYFLFKDIWRKK